MVEWDVMFRKMVREKKYAFFVPEEDKQYVKAWGGCIFWYSGEKWDVHTAPKNIIPEGYKLVLTNNKYLTKRKYAKQVDKEILIKKSWGLL